MDDNTRERFNAFVTRNILAKRDDILWAIEVDMFLWSGVMDYARLLPDDFNAEDLNNDAVGRHILSYYKEEWAKKELEKLQVRIDKEVAKTERRATYQDASELLVRATNAGTCSLRFETAMACAGLMAEILVYKGVAPDQPVVLNLLNRLPKVKDERGRDTSQQHQLPESEADNFNQCGYELYQLKTLWNSSIPELWDIMETCLPMAIDRGSYHRRLRAPLIPGGFMPEMRVRFGTCHVNGRSMKADGSGWYDPDHPEFASLVAQYGKVAFQFTAVNPETGHFAKGILYPMEGMNCGARADKVTSIMLDHLQVKGVKKKEHKGLNALGSNDMVLDGMFIGIMKAKTSMGHVSGCFETLENISVVPEHYEGGKDNPQYSQDLIRVKALVAQLTREFVDGVGEMGPGGLLGRATRDDPHLRRLAEFIAMGNQLGAGINPLSIPLLASKLRESLSRRMWAPANGAGITGRYPMVIIDDTVKPGTCVINGYKSGTELACWRFPTILPQALLVLKVVGGKEHHRVDDKVVPNVIYMNPHDITTCQQGDDDGDEVGISTDPRVIELFKHKLDNRIYHIEPSSEKLPHLASEEQGRAYLRKDPMGPVGKITIMRAGLLACGRNEMALAFSVLVQEAIDSQKNLVRMTSPYKAAKLENWYCDRAGEYHIHYQCNGTTRCLCAERQGDECPNKNKGFLTDNWLSDRAGEFDMDVVQECYDNELMAAGCVRVVKGPNGPKTVPGWPLGWRTQARVEEYEDGSTREVRIRKAVALDNWKSWREKQDGNFNNLVHLAHDVAMLRWRQWHESFKPSETLPAKQVLYRVLSNVGSPLRPLNITWQQYFNDLRKRSGLEAYGGAMKKARAAQESNSSASDEQARLARIDQARADLELALSALTAQELLTIWEMELTETWWYSDRSRGGRVYVTNRDDIPQGERSWKANKPNYAFMAVTSKHSAIMRDLGMEATAACSWLNDEQKLTKYIAWCRKQANPFDAMGQLIMANKGHHQEVHDDNGEHIHLADCPECMERLKTALVRSIRRDKTAKEQAATKELVNRMNTRMPHESLPELLSDDEDAQYDNWEDMADDPWA